MIVVLPSLPHSKLISRSSPWSRIHYQDQLLEPLYTLLEKYYSRNNMMKRSELRLEFGVHNKYKSSSVEMLKRCLHETNVVEKLIKLPKLKGQL
ncbi:hypothetical protein C5167_009125 [Papaver somniferum]|uniref:Uncharacterized protein n=1 Tax=Papaver somniferum TaxID=3469 RepID=A0A4Y7JWG4_PAPSO|nr:hypothetical protein C5167_009125 [Papaver somniferum]